MDKFQWMTEMNRRFTLLRECQAKMVELGMTNQDADFLKAIQAGVKGEINELSLTDTFIERLVVVPEKRKKSNQKQ